MTITEARKVKLGDKMHWAGTPEDPTQVTGEVVDVGYIGFTVKWADGCSTIITFEDRNPMLKLTSKVAALKVNQRISDAPSRSSEARPGVGGAVGSNTADGNGGVEGAHEGTTADKSELLPTQLPKEK